jgi:hypothetical protein
MLNIIQISGLNGLNTPHYLLSGFILNLPSVISEMDNQAFEFWRQKETFYLFQKSRPIVGPI